MNSLEALIRWAFVLFFFERILSYPMRRWLGAGLAQVSTPLLLLIWAYFYWLWGSWVDVDAKGIALGVTGVLAAASLWGASLGAGKSNHTSVNIWEMRSLIPFWFLFGLALLIRIYSPSLAHAEKLADLAFFQGALTDTHFPPMDRWLAGEPVNYYYFGYLLLTPVVRLAGVPVEYAFGLSMCSIFAWLGAGAYGLVLHFTRERLSAGLALFSLTLASNWEWIRQVSQGTWGRSFSWWNSSRAMPGTITEFPFFSFLLGDLHAHFMALPWMTVTAGLVVAFRSAWDGSSRLNTLVLGALTALAVGVHYPLNPWELPFMALLVVLVLGKRVWATAAVGALSFLLFLPFWLTYERPVSSVHWVPDSLRSSWGLFSLHWGLFLLPLVIYLVKKNRDRFCVSRFWMIATLALGLSLAIGWVFGTLVGLMAWVMHTSDDEVDSFARWLLVLSLGFVALSEVIHLDDLYGPKLKRMNTVFKFYMLAWWGLSLALPIFWSSLGRRMAPKKLIWSVGLTVWGLMSLVYPGLAVPVHSEKSSWVPTLDGIAHWQQVLPGEAEAVRWLRQHSEGQDVIWEAVGPPYQNFGRMAALSGRPTVLGWANHEWVWRPRGHALTRPREVAMHRLQQNPSSSDLQHFFQTYQIRWVVLGNLERQTYSPALLEALTKLPLAFRHAHVEIRKVPSPFADE